MLKYILLICLVSWAASFVIADDLTNSTDNKKPSKKLSPDKQVTLNLIANQLPTDFSNDFDGNNINSADNKKYSEKLRPDKQNNPLNLAVNQLPAVNISLDFYEKEQTNEQEYSNEDNKDSYFEENEESTEIDSEVANDPNENLDEDNVIKNDDYSEEEDAPNKDSDESNDIEDNNKSEIDDNSGEENVPNKDNEIEQNDESDEYSDDSEENVGSDDYSEEQDDSDKYSDQDYDSDENDQSDESDEFSEEEDDSDEYSDEDYDSDENDSDEDNNSKESDKIKKSSREFRSHKQYYSSKLSYKNSADLDLNSYYYSIEGTDKKKTDDNDQYYEFVLLPSDDKYNSKLYKRSIKPNKIQNSNNDKKSEEQLEVKETDFRYADVLQEPSKIDIKNYMECLKRNEPCDSNGSLVFYAFSNGCKKCTKSHQQFIGIVVRSIMDDYPTEWLKLMTVYDPKGLRRNMFNEFSYF